jgi:hypothetical protein
MQQSASPIPSSLVGYRPQPVDHAMLSELKLSLFEISGFTIPILRKLVDSLDVKELHEIEKNVYFWDITGAAQDRSMHMHHDSLSLRPYKFWRDFTAFDHKQIFQTEELPREDNTGHHQSFYFRSFREKKDRTFSKFLSLMDRLSSADEHVQQLRAAYFDTAVAGQPFYSSGKMLKRFLSMYEINMQEADFMEKWINRPVVKDPVISIKGSSRSSDSTMYLDVANVIEFCRSEKLQPKLQLELGESIYY